MEVVIWVVVVILCLFVVWLLVERWPGIRYYEMARSRKVAREMSEATRRKKKKMSRSGVCVSSWLGLGLLLCWPSHHDESVWRVPFWHLLLRFFFVRIRYLGLLSNIYAWSTCVSFFHLLSFYWHWNSSKRKHARMLTRHTPFLSQSKIIKETTIINQKQ